jgi:hypothetical protein
MESVTEPVGGHAEALLVRNPNSFIRVASEVAPESGALFDREQALETTSVGR